MLYQVVNTFYLLGFPGGSEGKASASDVADLGLIPGPGRSPGEGNGNPLQYSCLENPMDGEAWWATVHQIAESDMTERLHFSKVETVSLPSIPYEALSGAFSG